MEVINFAVVGTGAIGRKHMDTLKDLPDSKLVAVCDIQAEALDGQDVPFYSSIEAMLTHHPEIQIVNICTPNGLHARHAIQCIQAGKHVVIEKPMSLRKSDAEQIIFYALSQHVKVFCVMQNRYSVMSRLLKTLVSEEAFGEISDIHLNLFWNRGRGYYMLNDDSQHHWRGSLELDGGPLYTQFSHFIDLLYWLFGDLYIQSAQLANLCHQYVPEIEDTGTVTFKTHKGSFGTIRYSVNAPQTNIESSVLIMGHRAAIKVSGQYMDRIEMSTGLVIDDYLAKIPSTNSSHRLVFENVVEAIRNNTVIATNALEGLKVVDIIETIYNKAIRD